MKLKNITLALAALALLMFAALAVSCNEAPQEEPAVDETAAAATPASTAADAAKPAGEGGCGGCAEGEGCGGGKAADTTMAKAEGEGCGGDCGGEGGCGGDCGGEGGSKPAGGCSTCPGTAKTLTAMACDEKVVLAVDGMTCGSCENAIRETLATVDGVKLGVADHEEGKAWVAYDPGVASVEVITAAISGLGYTVGGEVDRVSAMDDLADGHERAAVYVDKLGCGDCTGRISEALSVLDGVDGCRVDREFNIVFVDYDPAAQKPAAFKAAILEAGYSAAMPGEAMLEPENPHCEGCTGEEHEAEAA